MRKNYALLVGLVLLSYNILSAQFNDQKKNFVKYEGLYDFYYDGDTDKIYLEVDNLNEEFLYVYSLSSGIADN